MTEQLRHDRHNSFKLTLVLGVLGYGLCLNDNMPRDQVWSPIMMSSIKTIFPYSGIGISPNTGEVKPRAKRTCLSGILGGSCTNPVTPSGSLTGESGKRPGYTDEDLNDTKGEAKALNKDLSDDDRNRYKSPGK